ncbi:DUF4339 domain-containing protein [Rhodomicrobium vannielii]|uniref:DUF4339 domain-containing protein n=1 Tax=Rhodomicrobium vannielii TaxID=1069 RepID=UPI0002E7CF21|nr:DUF4339 domain-containing protein [Rhodomicrobium vannielii]
MEAKWYYAENGACVGPTTSEEIIRRIERGKDQPYLIWTDGLNGRANGNTPTSTAFFAEELAAAPQRDVGPKSKRAVLVHRARDELIQYLAVSTYLAVCFGALIFFKAAVLGSEGIEYQRFGLALAKALILGKFVLVLERLNIGNRVKSTGVLFADVLVKALLFTTLLLVLTVAEEVIVGHLNGQSVRDVLKGFAGGTMPEVLATVVLMFLVLVPYFAYRELAAALGEATFSQLLFKRQRLKRAQRPQRR